MKNFIILAVLAIALLFGASWWSKSMQSNDPSIISRNGLHWHPTLEVYVEGEKQEIPANIGIDPQYSSLPMGMAPVHTHDDAVDGIVHLEFSGIVRKDDIILGKFLEIWGKNINSFGTDVKMSVNGVENTELANYVMRDGDKIELRYE